LADNNISAIQKYVSYRLNQLSLRFFVIYNLRMATEPMHFNR